MGRTILITTYETKNGHRRLVTSHGIDEDTLRTVIVSPDHPSELGAHFDPLIGEWVVDPDEKPRR